MTVCPECKKRHRCTLYKEHCRGCYYRHTEVAIHHVFKLGQMTLNQKMATYRLLCKVKWEGGVKYYLEYGPCDAYFDLIGSHLAYSMLLLFEPELELLEKEHNINLNDYNWIFDGNYKEHFGS